MDRRRLCGLRGYGGLGGLGGLGDLGGGGRLGGAPCRRPRRALCRPRVARRERGLGRVERGVLRGGRKACDRQRLASHFDEESRYFGLSGRRVWATLDNSRESHRLTVSVEGELAPGDMTAFDLLGRGERSVSVWERVAADRSGHGRGHTSCSYTRWGAVRRGGSASPFFVDPCWRTESALRSVAGRAPTVSVRRDKERVEFSLPVLGSVLFRHSKVAERRAKGFDASRVFELQSATDAGTIRARPLGAYEDSREVLKRVGAGTCELIAGMASAPKGHCKAGRPRAARRGLRRGRGQQRASSGPTRVR